VGAGVCGNHIFLSTLRGYNAKLKAIVFIWLHLATLQQDFQSFLIDEELLILLVCVLYFK
jgi:hypothetical protein